MKAEVRATYVTEWDDGETVLESPCKVNVFTHEVLHIGRRKIIQSPYTNSQIDEAVESLDEEYVRFSDGTCSNVVDRDVDWSFEDNNNIAPVFLGKGV